MGCNFSSDVIEQPKPKEVVYSWDRPENRLDPKDYTISDKTGGTFGRLPGKINGQQFIIENCKDTNIYLFDYCATVTVDNCENCNIFIGPSKGSVNIRNTSNCLCYVACQQFRTRECRKLNVHILCDTQPIIEASSKMKFACLQFYYPEFRQHLKSAGLSVFNNLWYKIYDFTPLEQGHNWGILNVEAKKALPDECGEDLSSIKFSCEVSDSIIPHTKGKMESCRFDESCLVVFFHISKSHLDAFLKELNNLASFDIIQSKEIQLSAEDVSRIFKIEKYNMLASAGPVVSLELNGDHIIKQSEEALDILKITLDHVYISPNQATSRQDIEAFYNFVEMSMT